MPGPQKPARTFSIDQLQRVLYNLDGAPYGQYKQLNNLTVVFDTFSLSFDHIQADPFSHCAPDGKTSYTTATRCHVTLNQPFCGFPIDFFSSTIRQVASVDYLTRQFWQRSCYNKGGEQGGLFANSITIDKPNQHVVQRNSITVDEYGVVEARFTVVMPGRGRKIQGRAASALLIEVLVSVGVEPSICFLVGPT
jgi:predicted ABC-class ATPase